MASTAGVVLSIKDSFLALPTKTGDRALEEVEKNISSLRQVLSGDGEAGANQEQVLQIALEICKEGVLSLFVQNLPSLGWGVRKDLVICWCILLGQKVDENYCCVNYKKSDLALNCGIMRPFRYILESNSFELFFEYVELPNFDIASDALNTFKDLLTKHETVVSVYLSSHYEQFFERYTRILTSTNYVTRRQSVKFLSEFLLEPSNSKIMKRYIQEVRFLNIMIGLLKDSSKNIKICAFHVFKVFVANPNKPPGIIEALRDNRKELLKLLHNLPASKGEDELDEERDLIIHRIEKL
uniref:Putative MO25-like protein n=1 Tax=Aegilops tauschii TaxID=37682 RepID=M8C627_AEGTA